MTTSENIQQPETPPKNVGLNDLLGVSSDVFEYTTWEMDESFQDERINEELHPSRSFDGPSSHFQQLNEFGAEGWELVSIVRRMKRRESSFSWMLDFYFKRRLSPEAVSRSMNTTS